MADATHTVFTVSVPTLAVLVRILVNNSGLSDLRSDVMRQIADLRWEMHAGFDEALH